MDKNAPESREEAATEDERGVGSTAQRLIVVLAMLFVVVYLAPSIFITIRAGEAGVLWRRFGGGTVIDRVYSEGLKVVFPWDKMTVYSVRVQEVNPELDVLTKTGLKIRLKLSIRYHPEYDTLGVLHQRVGPDYVDKIVIPEVESSLRTTIGDFDVEEVYTTQRAILYKIINEALEQVAQRFIRVDDVIIKEILLPETIQRAIEQKHEQEHLAKAYVYRLEREEKEAERREIEAGGHKAYNDIVNASLTGQILKWKGIEATKELATSENAKVVVIGNGPEGMPIILGADGGGVGK